MEKEEGARTVFGADGVGELVEAALFSGEDHSFDIAERDPVFSFYIEKELFKLAGDEHHVGAESVYQFAGGVGAQADWFRRG